MRQSYPYFLTNDPSSFVALPRSAHVNLNAVTKLRDVEFTWWLHPQLVVTTLRTIPHNHRGLRQITLALDSGIGLGDQPDVRFAVGETAYQEWLELDRLLVQLCESRSIRLEVRHNLHMDADGSKERSRMKILLPEVMTRGMVNLVGQHRR